VRPPILWIAAAFAAGLWTGLAGWPIVAPALCLAGGAAATLRRAPVAAACALAVLAGVLWGAAARGERMRTCAGRWTVQAAGSGGGAAGTRARITRAARVRLFDNAAAEGGMVDATVQGGPCGGRLRIRWPAGHPAAGGSEWIVAGRWLGRVERGLLAARHVRLADPVPRGRGAWRGRIAARARDLFGSRAPLVDALVLARRSELAPEVRERFARAGLAHLLAISGLHVGFLAAWLTLVLRWCGLGARTRFGVSAAIIGLYVWMLGAPAATLRAALMLAVGGVGRMRQRAVAPRGAIGLTVLLLLLLDPWALRAVGAWLSVAAVGAVVWAGRALARRPGAVRALGAGAAATLATAPITAYAFGTVAPVGIAANLVAIPLGAVAVPGLFATLLLSWIVPPVAALMAGGAGLALAAVDQVARLAAAVPGGHLVMATGWRSGLTWAALAAALGWVGLLRHRAWVSAARLAFLACVASWALVARTVSLDDPPGLAVHFLDVGQGDAAVLRTPHGHWVVLDGGPRGAGGDAGRRVVVPFLRRRGVARVSLVIASHGDADHLGGLPAVVETFRPALVLEPGEPLGKPLYLDWLAEVEASGARWTPARSGDRLVVDSVVFEVLSPDPRWASIPMDANEHSVVLRVRYGVVTLLFAGDAGLPVEARLAGRVGRVDVLKIGHHGSRSATSTRWLAELQPATAIISVGRGNRYGHPAPDVLDRLARAGIAVLRTDRAGTITLTTDGTRAHTDFRHHD